DKYACETYKTNIGPHVNCASIELIDLESLPHCDIVIGGPPCQGFSVAGKMDPKDPRSQLIWDYFKVVKAKRPRFFVMENVSALGKLEKFQAIRDSLFEEYQKLGYQIKFQILNSKDYEVPQKRERFILIGSLDPLDQINFPKPCLKEISAREAIIDLGEPGTGINKGICNAKITVAQHPVLRKSPYAGMLFNGLGRPVCLDNPAQTLPASMGGNKTPIIDSKSLKDPGHTNWVETYHKKIMKGESFDAYEIKVPEHLRRLTVREAARIQGFPDDFNFNGTQSQQYKQIGNAVPPKLAFHIATELKKQFNKKIKN
ncbi:MAG TPA: DNA (cytosine-5-)-methyltransferase, partial [Puia sp.]